MLPLSRGGPPWPPLHRIPKRGGRGGPPLQLIRTCRCKRSWRGADDRDVPTDLVIREPARERRFLCLPFNIHRNSELYLTGIRCGRIRNLTGAKRSGNRSTQTLTFLLQGQRDRQIALTQVDIRRPRSTQTIPTGTNTTDSRPEIDRTSIDEH